jgi:hypothetical protein
LNVGIGLGLDTTTAARSFFTAKGGGTPTAIIDSIPRSSATAMSRRESADALLRLGGTVTEKGIT